MPTKERVKRAKKKTEHQQSKVKQSQKKDVNTSQTSHAVRIVSPRLNNLILTIRDPQGYLLADHMDYFGQMLRSVSNYHMQTTDLIQVPEHIRQIEEGQKYLQIMFLRGRSASSIGHWITAYYNGVTVSLYNSMNAQTLHTDAAGFLQRLFPFTPAIRLCRVQAQQNGYDCGLFAIAFCVSVLYENDPEQETYDIRQLRSHAAHMFTSGHISTFPTVNVPSIASNIGQEDRIKKFSSSYMKQKSEESADARDQRIQKIKTNQKKRKANETVEEKNKRLKHNNERRRKTGKKITNAYKAAYRGLEEIVEQQYFGKMDKICEFCNAKHFSCEVPSDRKFTLCCRKGKHAPDVLLEYPAYMLRLVTGNTRESRNYREHIRSYNSALAFASMGAQVSQPPGIGPFTYRIHGQIYHNTKSLYPKPGEPESYAQLYIIDTVSALQKRMSVDANKACLPHVLQQLDILLRRVNPFSAAYMMLKEVEEEEIRKAKLNNTAVPEISMFIVNDRTKDKRRYNIPTCNEVAVVFTSNDGAPPNNRDICVHPRGEEAIRITQTNGNCDPMTYPLIFPHGDFGWTISLKARNGMKKISPLQFYVNRLQVRQNVFNPCLELGKLTQQYIVDAYCKVEAERLNYIRFNQGKFRVELYSGLMDHINNLATKEGAKPGSMIILPSTFQGGSRFMQQMYQNAMAIVREFGKPDLFITVTCNPKWREIIEELRAYQTACDRPDLVARVFSGKIRSLLDELFKDQIFGEVMAYMYVIEFQKRGLPHMHLLMMLSAKDKLRNRDDIDSIVSAEIPDVKAEPELFRIIRSSMIHGPCGVLNPRAPCMENNTCSKNYPKNFQEETCENVNGYPIYRRRNDGATMDILNRNGTLKYTVDNRWIVPYNPYLSKKYDAHINVEICSSVKSVKYICKYLCKGHDCASIKIGETTTNKTLKWDEINGYLDARYVSAPECCWRLWEFPMHGNSHTICQLAVHLENQQAVIFTEGGELTALEKSARTNTTLTAWFELNRNNVSARDIRYSDIPKWFVFTPQKTWKLRERTTKPPIGRMIAVSPKDVERFYLRMILSNVCGATSFDDLRTVDGVLYETYQEAARHRGLFITNDECAKCMREAIVDKFPDQLRQLFAFIICFCESVDAKDLWETFKNDLVEDFAKHLPKHVSENKALRVIEEITILHGYRLKDFGLPQPLNIDDAQFDVQTFDLVVEQQEGAENISKFNVRQREIMEMIMVAVNDQDCKQRYFFVDGPGGTGKTFLFNTIISALRGTGHVVVATAWTGIAGTLLKGGRTVHSTFKLGVPVTETTVAKVRGNSQIGQTLRKAKVILWDEVTIAPSHALRAVDQVLRDLMDDKSKPFGGKVVVLGGDFRQCLPIVRYTNNRTTIIEVSMLRSPLWNLFKKIQLEENMRLNKDELAFAAFLLKVGNGEYSPVSIPAHCIVTGSLVDAIYGNADIAVQDTYNMIDKAILCPKNEQTLITNELVLEKIPGIIRTYYSSDSIVSEDDDEIMNYPIEFLNKQTPSGMPPHKLSLKVGAIVMLLRNLNGKQGLCNGTRLMIKQMKDNVLDLEVLTGQCKGERIYLPRIDLAPSDSNLPFLLKRRQFPIRLAFSMTINKAQGQTFEMVGIDLQTPVFAHGQLYVAMSRVKSFNGMKVKLAHDDIDSSTGDGSTVNKCYV